MKTAAFTLWALAVLTGSAAAQTYSPPSSGAGIGVRGFAVVDSTAMAAADSFKALFGSSQVTAAGAGGEVDVWKHLFFRVSITRATRDGSRVFVDDSGAVFPLGIPLTVTMTPLEAGGGWRFASAGRVTPFVGAAFVSLAYLETSNFADAADNVNERYTGAAAFGGVDVAVWKGLFVGGEAHYRHVGVPDVDGTVMHAFGERDLGGFGAQIRIGFSTK